MKEKNVIIRGTDSNKNGNEKVYWMVIPDYYLVSFLVKPIETNENYVQNTHDDLRFIMRIDTIENQYCSNGEKWNQFPFWIICKCNEK